MVKIIDLMAKVLQQHNLVDCILDSVKKKTEDKPLEDQGKGHVLNTISSSYNRWILDSGSSNHMVASKHYFSSFVPCTRPPMLMGDKTPMRVCEEGSVDLDYGIFHNVLHILNISMNLLSIYQITHSSTNKWVEFTSDSMIISEMVDGSRVLVGEVDHHSRLYTFSHFVPKYNYVTLITHENEQSRENPDDKFEEGPLHAL
jgi:hypothetical protein